MEEILLRFSLIGRAIFKKLNGRDYCKSKEVAQSWHYFISNERAYTIIPTQIHADANMIEQNYLEPVSTQLSKKSIFFMKYNKGCYLIIKVWVSKQFIGFQNNQLLLLYSFQVHQNYIYYIIITSRL